MNVKFATGLAGIAVVAGAGTGFAASKLHNLFPAKSTGEFAGRSLSNLAIGAGMTIAGGAAAMATMGAGVQIGSLRGLGGLSAAILGAAAITAGVLAYNAS